MKDIYRFLILLLIAANCQGESVPALEGVQPGLVQPQDGNNAPPPSGSVTNTNPSVTTQATPPAGYTPNANVPPPIKYGKALPKPHTAPSAQDVRILERQLRSMKSQLRVDDQVERGTYRATHAKFLRAKTVFPYYESSIFELHTAPDHMTVIQLEPNETITGDNKPKAADTVQWTVETQASGDGVNTDHITNILVKPLALNIETDLFVATNKRVYYFVLKSDSSAFMPLVSFYYPEQEARSKEKSSLDQQFQNANQEIVGVQPENLNNGYSIEGSDVEWKPVSVFDDGKKTYLQMPAIMKNYEAPALFIMEEGSAPLLVNYRTKPSKNMYVVDRLFTTAQLRVGTDKKVDIVRNGTTKSTSFWPWE